MKAKKLLISCSNRSEYGLLRPILMKLNDSVHLRNISCTLLLFSDAIQSCAADIQRDCLNKAIQVEILDASIRREEESLGEHFARLVQLFSGNWLSQYDAVLIAGDRYENCALASRSFFEHVPVIHSFGGDVSCGGHFDDHLRHVISHFASAHFPVNEIAKANLVAMKQEPTRVFFVGSPVIDEIAVVGSDASVPNPWNVILAFNPMTLGLPGLVSDCLRATLEALNELSKAITLRCLATRPNNEPGSRDINQLLDEYSHYDWLDVVDSLGSPAYLYVIKDALLVVGNSSSQLLEAPVLRTHSLLIGDRQKGRFLPDQVMVLPGNPAREKIREAIRSLLSTPRPLPCVDYGTEGVTEVILRILGKLMEFSKMELCSKNTPLQIQ